MTPGVLLDEDLVRRLPLPLAQLYRRARNAKSAIDRHNAAYYLWEAALKLLGAVAIVEYAELGDNDPQLIERLKNLSRPAVGHWWEFVRRLVPVLAQPDVGHTPRQSPSPSADSPPAPVEGEFVVQTIALTAPPANAPPATAPRSDSHFDAIRTLLTQPQRGLPMAAGLMATLEKAAGQKPGTRATVRLNELFDRLVNYRNREIGHGAAGQRPPDFYQETGDALLAGIAEILRHLDVLAGRRLIHVADVRRLASGQWLVERYELLGESPRRIDSLELPSSTPTSALPKPERVYLLGSNSAGSILPADGRHSLHPLILYSVETAEVFFLNSRTDRGADFLCYSTGRPLRREELDADQRELLARLLHVPVDADVLGQWGRQAEAEQPESGAARQPGPAAARSLGEYELISRVGSGAMGVVYRAWQPSLGRQVAVKCLLRTGDPKAESRFFREIHALGRVEHPHLVKIYTSDSDGSQWFYAMEFVEGADLARVCELMVGSSAAELDETRWRQALTTARDQARSQEETISDSVSMPTRAVSNSRDHGDALRTSAPDLRKPAAERNPSDSPPAVVPPTHQFNFAQGHLRSVVDIVRQAAEAAHALHEAGVIHRDIKPGNIMLTAEGSHAVLMDLGLAQLADDTKRRLTATRQFVGTLRYASPEQLMAAPLDRRADVYSLGATLHELLTLQPLFNVTEATPTPDLMLKIIQSEPARPSRLNRQVPADLEAIVLKCLEKAPERRYGTAAELAADLARWERGDPVMAQPPTMRYLLGKKLRRHRGLAFSAMAALAALVFFTGLFIFNLNAAKDEALRARNLAEREKYKAQEGQYAADMRASESAVDEGNVGRAIGLVEPYRNDKLGADLREFEWRHLCWLCQGNSLATYHDHPDQVLSTAFSPDGRWLATSCADGSVLLHNPSNLTQEPFHLPKLNQGVQVVEFSPDGRFLACATGSWRATNDDYQVHLWNVAAQKFVTVVDDPSATKLKSINAVAFSTDGLRMATGSDDNQVRVWKLGPDGDGLSHELVARMPGYSQGANDVSFAPGSHRLALGWGNGLLEVWDVDDHKQIVDQVAHLSGIVALAFAPDGQTIVIASRDGPLFFWDMKAGRLSDPLESGQGFVESVRFTGDGSKFVTAGSNCTVVLWNFASRRAVARFRGHRDVVFSVAAAPHSDLIASASLDRTVKLWDTQTQREVPPLAHQGVVECLAFSPDGRFLLTAEGRSVSTDTQHTGKIYLWDIKSELPTPTVLSGHRGDVRAVAFSQDNRYFASAGVDKITVVWDAVTRKPVGKLVDDSIVTAVRFSSADAEAGPVLATGNEDGAVKIWNPAGNGNWTAQSLGKHRGTIVAVTFSPDGKLLVSAGGDGTPELYDVATRSSIALLEGHQGKCYTAEFSPDGALLATGSHDRTVRIWDVKGRKFHKGDAVVLQGYNASITTLAFSPDGKTLAGGSRDSSVTLWSVHSLKELAVFPAHTGGVLCSAFSPDGSMLATGGTDQTVKLWKTIQSTDGRELFAAKSGWSRP